MLDTLLQDTDRMDSVFQNIRLTMRFNELGQEIIIYLEPNATNILVGETVSFDASNTIVTNAADSQNEITFAW